ncbi:MAG: competence protein TfoX, partial [Bacteroidales bacterium]|nr:competence protein TfoX [Bacteroidales bacterium]
FAIEGAIQEIRWHDLEEYRKNELRAFYSDLENNM